MAEPHKSIQHKWYEDLMAFLLGTSMCALGVEFLSFAGLITGQTAGLGILLSYMTAFSFGVWFFVLNLPFYIFGWLRMGARFTVKSFIAVALLSLFSELSSETIKIASMPPVLVAFLGGATCGLGLIAVFRHGASLGGVGILALYLQEKTGFQAGWSQLIFDALLFGVAIFILPSSLIAWSLAGALVTNTVVGFNHRQDRYIAR